MSRRTGEAITISPEQAKAELKLFEVKIREEATGGDIGTPFAKYAEERSDCSSFQMKGDLGVFGRGTLLHYYVISVVLGHIQCERTNIVFISFF